jgi:hypothetical protein
MSKEYIQKGWRSSLCFRKRFNFASEDEANSFEADVLGYATLDDLMTLIGEEFGERMLRHKKAEEIGNVVGVWFVEVWSMNREICEKSDKLFLKMKGINV